MLRKPSGTVNKSKDYNLIGPDLICQAIVLNEQLPDQVAVGFGYNSDLVAETFSGTLPRLEPVLQETQRICGSPVQYSSQHTQVPARRNPSRLIGEPTLHPDLYIALIDELPLVRFNTATLHSFANLDGILNVFPACAIGKVIQNPSSFVLSCRHDCRQRLYTIWLARLTRNLSHKSPDRTRHRIQH
jgi:hypothetical protein